MTGAYFLGVDAGNSKTVALVADAAGHVLGRGRGGSGDIYSAPDPDGQVVLAVRTALADADLDPGRVRHAAFRLAGVDWPEDEVHWDAVLSARLPDLRSRTVKNDGFSLLRCGRIDGVGVAINVGTGPAVAARGPGGDEFAACWWIQAPLGGRDLGRAAIRAVIDAEFGVGPRTALTPALLALYGHRDVESLLHAVTRREALGPAPDERAAARPVLRTAGDGDPVALGLVTEQAQDLARVASTAARRVGVSEVLPVHCVLGGSVVTSEHAVYRDALAAALADAIGPVEAVLSAASPVAGALLDAMAEGGVDLDPAVHDRVVRAVHPADFLLT